MATEANRKHPIHIDSSNARAIIDQYDTILSDCDGVVWANDQFTKFEGVGDTVQKLRDLGKRLYFISNNTTYSAKSFVEKFQRMAGFEGRASEVISINDATAIYLRDIEKVQGKVFVIATRTLSDALEGAGLPVVGAGPSPNPLVEEIPKDLGQVLHMELDENVKAVVVGMDTAFDYNKLFRAANYLQDMNCVFVATNWEPRMTVGAGASRRMLPITGTIVRSVEAASGRQATIIGKPSPSFFTCVKAQHPELNPRRTVMIGDILNSDIEFATNCDIDSILVLTGIDSEQTLAEALRKDPKTPQPTYILSGVGDLGKWI